jgi:hypothetical protein
MMSFFIKKKLELEQNMDIKKLLIKNSWTLKILIDIKNYLIFFNVKLYKIIWYYY